MRGTAMSSRVAVLGTGIMGTGIARSLLRAGFEVAVWNRSPERAAPLAASGALIAATPAEAVAEAEVVFVVLFDADSVIAVLEESIEAGHPDAVWVQASTIGLDGARRVSELAARHRVAMVETMMMGTRPQAEDGTLILIGGGSPGLFARVQQQIQAISARIVHAGDRIGDGTAVKLACNSWVAVSAAGTAQALALVQAQGLDPRLWLEVLAGGTADSPYCHLKGAKMLAHDFSAQFAVAALRKDLALIRTAAEDSGMPTALLETLDDLYAVAAAAGHAGEDIAAVAVAFEHAPTPAIRAG